MIFTPAVCIKERCNMRFRWKMENLGYVGDVHQRRYFLQGGAYDIAQIFPY